MLIRTRDDAPATWFLNALMTTVATREETNGAYEVTEHLLTAASNPPLHIQLDEDEAFYVIDGEIEFTVDGAQVVAGAGTFAFVPRGASHTFDVRTDVARMLVITSGKPANTLVDFFTGMGEPARARTLPEPKAPDVDRLVHLANEAGVVFV